MIQDCILQQALNITHVLPTLCGLFRQIIAFSRCLCHNECDSLIFMEELLIFNACLKTPRIFFFSLLQGLHGDEMWCGVNGI